MRSPERRGCRLHRMRGESKPTQVEGLRAEVVGTLIAVGLYTLATWIEHLRHLG